VKTDLFKLESRLNFHQNEKNEQKIITNSQVIGLFLYWNLRFSKKMNFGLMALAKLRKAK
tara:strand:- start:279 stop:458 length:180 start_codon:yes stop_codon:yes gene_type:complete